MCEKNAIRIETSRNQIKRLKVPKWLKHGVQNEPTKIDQNGSFFWTINEEPNGPKQIHHWMISFVRNHLGIRAISDQLTSMSQQWTNPSLDILYLHNCPVWHANPLCKTKSQQGQVAQKDLVKKELSTVGYWACLSIRIVSPRSSESKQRTRLCYCYRSKMWLLPWLTAPNDRSFASRITPCHFKFIPWMSLKSSWIIYSNPPERRSFFTFFGVNIE